MERLSTLTETLKNQSGKFTAARYLQSLAIGKGHASNALAFADEQRQWLDRAQIVGALKTAVSSIGTADFSGALQPVADSFLAALREVSIPLRLVGLRKTPMNTRTYVNLGNTIGARVDEGGATPVLAQTWGVETLTPKKFAAIVVATDELFATTSPTALQAIINDLAGAVAEAENAAFLNADVTGSVLYGQTGLTAAGSALSNVDSDLKLLIAAVRGASSPNAVFVMSKQTASFLGTLRGTGGGRGISGCRPSGGELLGLQVLVSTAAEDADSPSTKIIALLSPSEILWGDDGRVELSTSKNASLKMDDASTAAAGSLVSSVAKRPDRGQSDSRNRVVRESGRCCVSPC